MISHCIDRCLLSPPDTPNTQNLSVHFLKPSDKNTLHNGGRDAIQPSAMSMSIMSTSFDVPYAW